jgi:hypothetical protein
MTDSVCRLVAAFLIDRVRSPVNVWPAQSVQPAMAILMNDIRLALRGLRRSPLFATVAILSLALGIGANTAIFTLLDQLLLR